MLRNTSQICRAFSRHAQRRFLHEDSREEFLRFSVTRLPGSDPRFGMDMTRAPGYEIEPEQDIPLAGKQKLADFAARHARLSTTQVEHADGYIWIGSVLYPAGVSSDADVTFSWEIAKDDSNDAGRDVECVADISDSGERDSPIVETKRRYTGGQARRIRKERAKNALKRANRRPNRRPVRKPENDIPPEEEQ